MNGWLVADILVMVCTAVWYVVTIVVVVKDRQGCSLPRTAYTRGESVVNFSSTADRSTTLVVEEWPVTSSRQKKIKKMYIRVYTCMKTKRKRGVTFHE